MAMAINVPGSTGLIPKSIVVKARVANTAARAPIRCFRRDWGYESMAAAVVTDTVIGTAAPVTFTLGTLGEHELPAGAPVQLSATIPVNPDSGVTATL